METNVQPPAARPDDGIFDAADEWAGNRAAKQLIKELFVRVSQLAVMYLNVCRVLGLDDMGEPIPGHPLPWGKAWPGELPRPEDGRDAPLSEDFERAQSPSGPYMA
jgi:hypothetical protein